MANSAVQLGPAHPAAYPNAAALADKERAQQRHEEAVVELEHVKQQLQQLTATRSQADVDASK